MTTKKNNTSSALEYQVKPKHKEKFRPGKAKEIIKEVLEYKLKNQNYNEAPKFGREIADTIKGKLKDLGLPRYKYVVHVLIGQQKGQGVRVGGKNLWDLDTDYCTSETYMTDEIFCLATVYAIYYY